MRACVVTSDLGKLASRKAALVQKLGQLSADTPFTDVVFAAYRCSHPGDPAIRTCQPYVPSAALRVARFANAILRLVDAGIAPPIAAKGALRLCGPSFVELVLASEPDVVLLDVNWGRYLKADLELEGMRSGSPGGEPRTNAAHRSRKALYAPAVHGQSAKVSIVLPTHNGISYLRQAISSCLGQSHHDLELIVVDDGSSVDIGAVVSAFDDSRVRYIRHERNRGLPAALNTGFSKATGEYLTWTSDDNYYAPDAIERMLRILQRYKRIGFVYSSMFIVDESQPSAVPQTVRSAQPPEDLARENCVGACFLVHQAGVRAGRRLRSRRRAR